MGVDLIINNIVYNGVESISIPKTDGVLAKFVLKTITNRVPISIGTDGKVYNANGWKGNTRLSGSSGGERDTSYGSITGFIPVKAGDVVRFKYSGTYKLWNADTDNGVQAYNIVAYYKGDFVWLGSCAPLQGVVYGICKQADQPTGNIEDGGIVTFTVPSNSGVSFLRLSFGTYTISEVPLTDLTVTVNEEIK